jgi:hypothetical protein
LAIAANFIANESAHTCADSKCTLSMDTTAQNVDKKPLIKSLDWEPKTLQKRQIINETRTATATARMMG